MLKQALIGAAAALTLAGVAALAPRAEAPAAAPAEYAVDGVHSFVVFRCKHNNAAYAYGMFHQVSGSVAFDAASPESSSLTVEVKTDSVSTGQEKRDGHLRKPDFFSSSEFPTSTFKSTAWKKTGENTFDVTGDFTLRGVTKQVTAKVEKTGESKGQGGKELIGFEGTLTINRMDYGVKYGPGALGDEVRLTLSIEADKK